MRPVSYHMRVASYFVLSLALHAAALTYPASFTERKRTEIMRVTIQAVEREPEDSSALAANGNAGNDYSALRPRSKSIRSAPLKATLEDHTKRVNVPEPEAIAAEQPAAVS